MTWHFQNPTGGIFAIVGAGGDLTATERELTAEGGDVVTLPDARVLLGSFRDLSGRGTWSGDDGAVAWDVDLTNADSLRARGGEGSPSSGDLGASIWHLYRDRGADFADVLRGAFRIALWDRRGSRLLLVTDPYGIKEVLYTEEPGGLRAAGRACHLHSAGGASGGFDLEAIYHYLFFSAIPTPHTIYSNIRRLPPGHALIFENGATSVRSYYDIRYRPEAGARETHWRARIFAELEQAVGRFGRLSGPGDSGCFLSGGTDSSSVSGFLSRLWSEPPKTFSIGFDEPGYNELQYARIAADRFATRQHDYRVTPEDVLTLIERLPDLYDEPFGNSSVIPTYYCAALARSHGADVLLAGDGGDEIFGGNERYVTNLLFERYRSFPGVLRRYLIEPLLSVLPPVGVVYKGRRYVRRANMSPLERFYSYNLLAEMPPERIFRPEYLSRVDTGCFHRLAQEHYERAAPADVTDRLLYVDMKLTITDNDLRKVTRMAEAAGARVRYPFLDRDLVDFTATIPPALKVRPGRNRYIFKRAMEGFLPQQIIEKKKHGFGLPISVWFREHPGLRSLLGDTLFSGEPMICEWIRPEFLREIERLQTEDETPYYGDYCWVLLIFESWLRRRSVGRGVPVTASR